MINFDVSMFAFFIIGIVNKDKADGLNTKSDVVILNPRYLYHPGPCHIRSYNNSLTVIIVPLCAIGTAVFSGSVFYTLMTALKHRVYRMAQKLAQFLCTP